MRKLDALVKEIVIKRDKACVTCPIWRKLLDAWAGSNELQPGHLFSRVAYSTRWDLNNVFCQCRNCNLRHEYDSFALAKYFKDKFGEEAYDALHYKYVHPVKFKTYELVELYETLKKEKDL